VEARAGDPRRAARPPRGVDVIRRWLELARVVVGRQVRGPFRAGVLVDAGRVWIIVEKWAPKPGAPIADAWKRIVVVPLTTAELRELGQLCASGARSADKGGG
jgi:hypothetical protein